MKEKHLLQKIEFQMMMLGICGDYYYMQQSISKQPPRRILEIYNRHRDYLLRLTDVSELEDAHLPEEIALQLIMEGIEEMKREMDA